MSSVCQNPDCKAEIADGDRLLSVGFSINWGADDLRNAWHGDYAFDSFACLAAWAAAKAGDHDGHVLKDGA